MKTIKFTTKRQVDLFKAIMRAANIFVPEFTIGQLVHFDLITDKSQIENELSNDAICDVIWYKNNALMRRELPVAMIGIDGDTDIPDTAVVVFYPTPYSSDSSVQLGTEIMYRYIPIAELRKMELWRPSLLNCNEMVKFLTDIGIGIPEVLPEYVPPLDSETRPHNNIINNHYINNLPPDALKRLTEFTNHELAGNETDKDNSDPLVRLADFISRDLDIPVDDHILKYYLLGALSLLEDRRSKRKQTPFPSNIVREEGQGFLL